MIAIADGERTGEVRLYEQVSSYLGALEEGVRKPGGEGVVLHVVYEAGPTGFVGYRAGRFSDARWFAAASSGRET